MSNDATIDLSHYQPRVNFAALAAGGIRLVIHKATEGTGGTDSSLAGREALARSVGIAWGTYHFLRPGSAKAQAEHYLQVVNPPPGALCVCDVEAPGVSAVDVVTWCERVEEATGVKALVYGTAGFLDDLHLDPNGRPLWIARYPLVGGKQAAAWSPGLSIGRIPTGWTADQVLLWQYTSAGVVPGVDGPVDRSVGDVKRLLTLYPAARAV